LTNILFKINLRSLIEMMSQRLCNRTQKEFQSVMFEIKEIVLKIHPWLENKLRCYCDMNKRCFFKNGKGCGKYENS
jgi:thymidylate synthase ThyX